MSSFWPDQKEQPWFFSLGVVVLALLAIFLAAKAWNEMAMHPQIGVAPITPNVITIDGEGKMTAQPTLAVVNMGLYSEGATVVATQTENTRKVNAIIAAVKALGVKDADVQTSNYNLNPRYDYQNNKQTLIGYSVSQTVDVKVRDLSKVGDALTAATQAGANMINGVSFTIDDPSQLKQEARAKAVADAKTKAEELAKALGVSLIRVTAFSESSDQSQPPMPMMAYRTDAAQAPVAAPAPDIQSGSLDVTSHVSVSFELGR